MDVNDIASAHVNVFQKLTENVSLNRAYNLGYGSGTSVLEIIKLFKDITQKEIEIEFLQARNGDPLSIVSNYNAALNDLEWSPEISISESVESQVRYFRN